MKAIIFPLVYMTASAMILYPGYAAAQDDDTALRVKEGQKAPEVELPATQIGKVLPDKKDAGTLKLADFEGKKNVVLFFFPKAQTPGCTIESCGFRDRIEQFAQLDTVIIGISSDKLKDQEAFTSKESLNFPLFADAEMKAIRAFGVKYKDRNVAQRKTFVIDKQRVIRKIYEKVDPRKHPDEVLAYVKENLGK